jgi:hypothetical protein
VALAMHNYADEHGRLPPAVVYGDDGRPLHRWRVLILPYIGEDDLYKEFRLDEPWDSPHNLALAERMPPTYADPGSKKSKLPPHHTVLHVFVGKGAAFEWRKGLKMPDDFPDGTSNTLLVVEAGPPVLWTKPEDLAFDPNGPLPELTTIFKKGFRAGLGDGSTRWIKKDISEATLRAAITRNGRETPASDW